MRSDNWVQGLIHIRQKGEVRGREGKVGKGDVKERGRGMKMGKAGRKVGTVSRYSKQARLLSRLLMSSDFLHRLSMQK